MALLSRARLQRSLRFARSTVTRSLPRPTRSASSWRRSTTISNARKEYSPEERRDVDVLPAAHVGRARKRVEAKRAVEKRKNPINGCHHKHPHDAPKHVLNVLFAIRAFVEIENELHETPHEEKKPRGEYHEYRRVDDVGDEILEKLCAAHPVSRFCPGLRQCLWE